MAALTELEHIRAYEGERLAAIARGDFFSGGLDRVLGEHGAEFLTSDDR